MSHKNRVKMTEEKRPRFTAGQLVMLSRKNTKSGELPFFDDCKGLKEQEGFMMMHAGFLNRGVPVLLIKNPIELIIQKHRPPRRHRTLLKIGKHMGIKKSSKKRIRAVGLTSSYKKAVSLKKQKNVVWAIRFVLNSKIFRMYLTNNQYHQELVVAAPRRIQKDYSDKKSAPLF